MKSLDMWLEEYGESHRNPVNKTIHWICVPVIQFCVLGLLYSLHPYAALTSIAISLIFYATLSLPLTLGMLAISIAMLALISALPHVFAVCLTLFVLAWAGQFYGHRVEGKKPSFFKDLQFLLVGPVWLLNFIYQRLGLPA